MIGELEEPFGVSNPHPSFGKDDNVANEFGHTHYPKYVHKFSDKGQIEDSKLVENEDEENELEGYAVTWSKPKVVAAPKSKAKSPFDK